MRVRQGGYLSLWSDDLLPDAMTAIVGTPPDIAKPRGSRRPGPPPVPRGHIWQLHSGIPEDRPLEEHFDVLCLKIAAIGEGILELRQRDEDLGAGVNVVRYFNEGPEDFDEATWGVEMPGFEHVGGQHPLLGFHLELEHLRLLGSLGLSIDFDEYGLTVSGGSTPWPPAATPEQSQPPRECGTRSCLGSGVETAQDRE